MKTLRRVRRLTILCRIYSARAGSSVCDVCGTGLRYTAYTFIDQVDHTRKWLCVSCADLTTVCYMCGVPVREGYLTLADGRVICWRDRAGVVLDEAKVLEMCQDVDGTLQALLGRFTNL